MVINREDRMLISLSPRERLRFKEVISWISKQSIWTDTSGVYCVGNLRLAVLVIKDKKYHKTGMQFIEILHTVPEFFFFFFLCGKHH